MSAETRPHQAAAAERLITEAFEQLLDVDPDGFTNETPLPAVEGWDSVNALRLLVHLEQELGVPLDFERFTAVESVGDLVALVAGTAGAPAGDGRR
jgi:acyl carrier protein